MDKSEYRKKEWKLKTIPEEEFQDEVLKFMLKQLTKKNYIISKQNKIAIRVITAFSFYLVLTLSMTLLFNLGFLTKNITTYTILFFSGIFIIYLFAETSYQMKLFEQIKKQLIEETLIIEEIKRRIKTKKDEL